MTRGLFFLALLGAVGCARRDQGSTTVAAAASLRVVMPALVSAFDGGSIEVSYGSSGELRAQVQAGAPVDLVLFAHPAPLRELAREDASLAGSMAAFARNELVVAVPRGQQLYRFAELSSVPVGERIAVGDPESVPAGQYAVEALEDAGTLEVLRDRFVYGGDVTQVVAYVRRGEVAAGLVYRTDLVGIGGVDLVEAVPAPHAPRVELWGGLTSRGARDPRAIAFWEFVRGPGGQGILAAKGFGPP